MLTSELEVLKPIDPSISDPDEYEIFLLKEAQVVYEKNGKPASLLAAYADIPLRVEGRLEVSTKRQSKYLIKKPFKPLDIQITNVTRFSYGQSTDGELMIWALGEAGWFELSPSPSYSDIYNDMVEAVEILYFVSDIYNEPRKRGGGPSAQLIFQEYAEDERFPCADPDLAAQIFHKHRAFLFMSFLDRAQGIGWSNTPLYQYFKRQCPKDFESAKARKEGRFEQPAKKVSNSLSSAAPPKARSRGKAQDANTSEAPKKDDNWWEAAALFEFMQKAVNHRVLRTSQGHITVERVAKLVVRRYEIDELEVARNYLLVHAQNLCYMMDHPRRQSIRFFTEEPIYRELAAGHNLAATEIRRAEGIELKPRRLHSSFKDERSDDSESSEEEAIATPRQQRSRKPKGRLSILRPKSGKFSRKGKSVAEGKRPNTAGNTSDSENTTSQAEPMDTEESEVEINTPTQALSLGNGKRKLSETVDYEEQKGRWKRAASSSLTPESPPSTENEDEEADGDATLPLRYHPNGPNGTKADDGSTKPALVVPIITTPLPTYEANGPRDSWICTVDGCSQKIFGASTEVGQQLITEHFEDHAKGRHKEVGILLREEERLRLPVNNLLKRIREMADQQDPLFPSSSLEAAAAALQTQSVRRGI
ncbi:hypothetical protein BS50DRAFT_588765 [Corynespora cassiicola Philippines]|uniref:DNA (cytosine-5)-methyltransferase 1 replication foci domain-containing protein n=1 Tax=Corynespora cassiicola Philippines TaxID=1448308 RepID=A0A2T2NKM2_CORCC|nr:hypothetical protein BS50DRAFT_588765 [Corynespora cassiicola Philippines]